MNPYSRKAVSGVRTSKFSTAGGTGVRISEAALARGRSFIAGIGCDDDGSTRENDSQSASKRHRGSDESIAADAVGSVAVPVAPTGSSAGHQSGVGMKDPAAPPGSTPRSSIGAVSGVRTSKFSTDMLGLCGAIEKFREYSLFLQKWVSGVGGLNDISLSQVQHFSCFLDNNSPTAMNSLRFSSSTDNVKDFITRDTSFSAASLYQSESIDVRSLVRSLATEQLKQLRLDILNLVSSQNISRVTLLYNLQSKVCSNCVETGESLMEPGEMATDDHACWIRNQVNWVVWTLASYERTFPREYLGKLLCCCNIRLAVCSRYKLFHVETGKAATADLDKLLKPRHHGSALRDCVVSCTITAPLVVCISILEKKSGGFDLQVSDGWWWCAVKVDKYIEDELIRTEKLKDGCKLVIFDAHFENTPDDPILLLHYNGIRKARNCSKLGYVRQCFLLRNLSVKSLVPGGGRVYSVGIMVKFISPTVVKIRTESSKSSPLFLHLTNDEFQWWLRVRQQQFSQFSETLASEQQYAVQNFVKRLNCSQRIKNTIMAIENGCDAQDLSPDDVETLEKASRDLCALREGAIRDAAQASYSEIKSSTFSDILGICAVSGRSVWIRCDHSTPAYTESLFGRHRIGSQLVVTYLEHISGYQGRIPMLRCSNNSALIWRSPSFPREQPVDTYHTWSDANVYPSSDETVRCVIIGWRQDKDVLEIHGVDKYLMTIVFRYQCPPHLASDYSIYPWIGEGCIISITYCTIKEYDKKYDILVLTRVEHTAVVRDSTVSTCTFFDHCGGLELTRLCENEKCRYDAVRKGQISYQKSDLCGNMARECCTRKRLCHAHLVPLKHGCEKIKQFIVNGNIVLHVPANLISSLTFSVEGIRDIWCDVLMTPENPHDMSSFVALWLGNVKHKG